ncbi:TPA: HNH endonuclease signature motif containing protein [Vibrio parahaemolyticus]
MAKVCAAAGCRNVTSVRFCKRCADIHKALSKDKAKKRARASTERYSDKFKSFYASKQWKDLRTAKIKKDPLCEVCLKNGFIREGKDIDHIIEIKDDYSRRLDMTNLQTLCRSCHMAKTSLVRKNRTPSAIE